jgi:hypothetical protein
MMTKNNDEMYWTMFIWLGLFVGSALGSYVPLLWDESMWSVYGILFSAVGALTGIAIGFKISRWMS